MVGMVVTILLPLRDPPTGNVSIRGVSLDLADLDSFASQIADLLPDESPQVGSRPFRVTAPTSALGEAIDD